MRQTFVIRVKEKEAELKDAEKEVKIKEILKSSVIISLRNFLFGFWKKFTKNQMSYRDINFKYNFFYESEFSQSWY